ncbi:hypothetical protein F4778DRAFT_744609 [Xylariomycetidae sp. FL2044]|nr:hypothetical protein F4778DRAFT_744609 [Xylariomycetidae sp. FL2044]
MADNNEFPVCNNFSLGIPCSCPSCNRQMINNMAPIESQPGRVDQDQARPPEETTQQQLDRFFDREHIDNFFSPPATQLPNFQAPASIQLAEQARHAIQHPSPSGPSHSIVPRYRDSPTPSEIFEDSDVTEEMVRNLRRSKQRSTKNKPVKRIGSKGDPKKSMPIVGDYGPPWKPRDILQEMTPKEREEAIDWNNEQAEAKKTFLKAKNNLAAKRSRERKQQLIDDLTAEVERLRQTNREMARENASYRQLSDQYHRTESDNVRLRMENDQLRGRLDAMTEQVQSMMMQLQGPQHKQQHQQQQHQQPQQQQHQPSQRQQQPAPQPQQYQPPDKSYTYAPPPSINNPFGGDGFGAGLPQAHQNQQHQQHQQQQQQNQQHQQERHQDQYPQLHPHDRLDASSPVNFRRPSTTSSSSFVAPIPINNRTSVSVGNNTTPETQLLRMFEDPRDSAAAAAAAQYTPAHDEWPNLDIA